jgi:hypothetical protein
VEAIQALGFHASLMNNKDRESRGYLDHRWYICLWHIIFNLHTAAFKAYCAIWVRCFNFCHQVSPRMSPRDSTQRWKVELWARNVREFCLNAEFHVTFRDLLRALKLWHGIDRFTSPLTEVMLRILFALKIWRLRPCANLRTWVPKASTLPLDHRSCLVQCNPKNTLPFYLPTAVRYIYTLRCYPPTTLPYKQTLW